MAIIEFKITHKDIHMVNNFPYIVNGPIQGCKSNQIFEIFDLI